jgi:TrkA-N domain
LFASQDGRSERVLSRTLLAESVARTTLRPANHSAARKFADKASSKIETSMLAHRMKKQVIVVGCGHLGRRLVEHLRQTARPYVLIDKDATVVDDLIRAWEPVVVDDAKREITLIDAGVDHAELIVITANNIETALLVTKRARDRNKKAKITVRCYIDEFTNLPRFWKAWAPTKSSRAPRAPSRKSPRSSPRQRRCADFPEGVFFTRGDGCFPLVGTGSGAVRSTFAPSGFSR